MGNTKWQVYRGPLWLLAVIIIAPLLAGGTYSYLLPLMQLCGLYTIIVIGLTLLMGYTGQISLGHAGLYGFGAYVAAVATTAYHLPLVLAILLALAAGALLTFVTGFFILRLKGHYLALATLCLGIIIWQIINTSKITGGAGGLFDLPEINPWGLLHGNPKAKVYFVWAFSWCILVWAIHLTSSPVGRALQAIHGDEEAAASLGVPVFALKLKIFIISGVLSALAGILYAFVYTPSYLGPEEFGLMLSVTLVTMVVIGGMGSIWGGLAGAVFMTSLHEIITLIGEKMGLTDIARFEQLLYGILLVLVLIFCPQGLAPGLNRGVRRLFQNLLSLRTR